MRAFPRLALLLTFLAALGLTAWKAFADSPALTEDEYWSLVHESRAEISRLKNGTAEDVVRGMEDLASRWEAITEVSVSGKIIPVEHSYLTDLMRANPPDLAKLDEFLATLLESQQTAPIAAFTETDLEPLSEILARPEFQWAAAAPNPIAEWFQKILDTINRWLNEILNLTFDVAGSDLTGVIMAVILAVILIFVLRTLFTDFLQEEKLSGEGGDEEPLTSESAFAKAQQLSRGGDYRAAVRYLYLSTLLILDERGLMRYDRSKTNREYLRSVRNAPELSEPLEEVIDVFDNVWYGHHALGEESFKHYSDRVEELKEKKA